MRILSLFIFFFFIHHILCYTYCGAPSNLINTKQEGYELVGIQVMTRHGDRVPLHTLPYGMKSDETWKCDLNELENLSNQNSPTQSLDRIFRKSYIKNRECLPGNCYMGQLTDIGVKQHQTIGENMRSLYIDKLKLLPPTYDPDYIYLRSYDEPRTIQSMENLVKGLYPLNTKNIEDKKDASLPVFQFHTIENEIDNVEPNPSFCPAIQAEIDKRKNEKPYLEYVQQVSNPLLNKISQSLNITLPDDSIQYLSDTLHCFVCHNKTLPEGINMNIVEQFFAADNWESNYMYNSTDVSRFSFSTLYQDWKNVFDGMINGSFSQKFFLYSSSDTALRIFLTGLGAFDGLWPSYASHLTVELYRKNHTYYISSQYNGKIIYFKGCPTDGSLCPYETVRSLLNSYYLPDYRQACLSSFPINKTPLKR